VARRKIAAGPQIRPEGNVMSVRISVRLALASAAVAVVLTSTAPAHPGHDPADRSPTGTALRVWTNARDGTRLLALFNAARDGRVHLSDLTGRDIVRNLADLSPDDQTWVRERTAAIRAFNGEPAPPYPLARLLVLAQPPGPPAIAKAFEPFAKKVKVTWDDQSLLVESDGLPEHPMMKGIRSWQQQVPLPQPYAGRNAWRIPLKPVLADKPISAKTALYRGAIALAVNGVPIFNALNNRGEDAFRAGELDEWGGHCGRADDYHYHVAPLHLEKVVGRGNPIAFALDGFPLYGLTEADGSPPGPLDEFNGKFGRDGTYRYHATQTYPYVNGGLRGVVQVRGDQVEPQPRSFPVRPALPPLRGATITNFRAVGPNGYRLVYQMREQERAIEYTIQPDGTYRFTFEDGPGRTRTETYRRTDRAPR
jgi:hypothetical protein